MPQPPPPPPELTNWLSQNFPRPQIDPAWVQECYDWLTSPEEGPKYDSIQAIIDGVRNQLLFSVLADSTLPDTGLPHNISELNGVRLQGPPILVEVVQIEEIGHSALSLQKTMRAREERMAAGETEDGDPLEEDGIGEVGGRIPRYQRSMLKLHISDGSRTIPAIEYRRIPDFELGVTNLGYKLQLKDVLVRGGVAFLEPASVNLLGYRNTDLDNEAQKEVLMKSLRFRLGQLEPDPQPLEPQALQEDIEMPVRNLHNTRPTVPLPARASLNGTPPGPVNPRPPLRDVTEEFDFASYADTNDDDDMPHRRKLPHRPSQANNSGLVFPNMRQSNQDALAQLSQRSAASSKLSSSVVPPATESTYFSPSGRATTSRLGANSQTVHDALRLSPSRSSVTLTGDNPEDNLMGHEIWSASLRPAPPGQHRAQGQVDDAPFRVEDDNTADMSSDFGDANVDHSFIEALDEVERQASASHGPRSQTQEVIAVDSDEEDDKENAPAASRHVRRRVGAASPLRTQGTNLGVVEISDSD